MKHLKSLLLIILLITAIASAQAQEVTRHGIKYSLHNGGAIASAANKDITTADILSSVTIDGKNREVRYITGFEGCSKLTSVNIPNSVTSIWDKAFSRCTALTSVTIGKNVETIYAGAFDYCFALKTIKVLNPYPPNLGSPNSLGYGAYYIGELTFPHDVRENGTLIVPAGSAKYYKTRPYWREFVNIQEAQQ